MRYVPFFLLILFASCELELDVDIPPATNESAPFVICFASITQPTLAYIGKTIPLGVVTIDSTPVQVVSVEIYSESGSLTGELMPTSQKGMFSSGSTIPFQLGTRYSLVVETIEFGRVYSDLELPSTLTVLDTVQLEQSSIISNNVRFSCFFTPEISENSFWGLKALYYVNNAEVFDNDQYNHIPYQIFNTQNSNIGSQRTEILQVPRNVYNQSGQGSLLVDEYKIILFHFSPALGTFIQSINANEGTISNVENEPSLVFSNIKNGYGIFGFFQADTLTIIP